MTTSITMPKGSRTDEVLPSPPAGRKWCWCGCKGTLAAESKRNHLRGHRPAAQKKIRAAASATRLPNLLKDARAEIQWREQRQRDLEKETGLNVQRIRVLREVVEKMESIQEPEREG